MADKYITSARACDILGVCELTLHNWEKKNKIDTIRTAGRHRKYNVEKYLRENKGNIHSINNNQHNNNNNNNNKLEKTEKSEKSIKSIKSIENQTVELEKYIGIENTIDMNTSIQPQTKDLNDNSSILKKEKYQEEHERVNVCYVRISSVKNIINLKLQKELMKAKYPDHIIVEDIGSSMNFDKKGLKQIIDFATNKQLNNLVIVDANSTKNFGFELIEYLVKKHSNGNVIIENMQDVANPKEELVDDVMQILNSCSLKLTELKKSL
jgi:predicted site-specific integrase-resolvase